MDFGYDECGESQQEAPVIINDVTNYQYTVCAFFNDFSKK